MIPQAIFASHPWPRCNAGLCQVYIRDDFNGRKTVVVDWDRNKMARAMVAMLIYMLMDHSWVARVVGAWALSILVRNEIH